MSTAFFSRDILLFLEMLRKHRGRYLVVGGAAVIHYGYARFTAEMDLFFEADAANAARLCQALQELWGGAVPGIENADVLRGKGTVFQFGRPPNRLDLLNSIDGVAFPAAWKGRKNRTIRASGRASGSALYRAGGTDPELEVRRRNKDLDDLRFPIEARRRRIRKPSPRRRPR